MEPNPDDLKKSFAALFNTADINKDLVKRVAQQMVYAMRVTHNSVYKAGYKLLKLGDASKVKDFMIEHFKDLNNDAMESVLAEGNAVRDVQMAEPEATKLDEVQKYIRSKADYYDFLRNNQKLFLPVFEACPAKFLVEILCSKKKAFKLTEVKKVDPPTYKELKLENFLGMILDPKAASYLPAVPLDKAADRGYFFTILNTVFDGSIETATQKAMKVRKDAFTEETDPTITIRKDIVDELLKGNTRTTASKQHQITFMLTPEGLSKEVKKKSASKQHTLRFTVTTTSGPATITLS